MDVFQQSIANAVGAALEIEPGAVLELLSRPPKPDMGDIALPCFQFAKQLRQAPPKIAAELANKLDGGAMPGVGSFGPQGPYLNFWLAPGAVLQEAWHLGERLAAGHLVEAPTDEETGAAPVLTIDFSSPNIAKEFHVAHLRSTALGWSLVQIHQALGWKTVGINHLGDWGTQFGHLINGYRKYGDEAKLEREPIKHLQQLYVRATGEAKEAEKAGDDSLQNEARATFKALEDGDPEVRALWERFRSLSLEEFNRIYDLLGVDFDTYEGEAFYNDKIEPLIEKFKAAGVAEQETLEDGEPGPLVVRFGEDDAPLLLRKSDGASTYGARDLAAVDYRVGTYKFARNVYCVDLRQSQHFRQVFDAYAKLGAREAEMAARCQHVPFGAVTVDGMIMATRQGNVLLLEEYIEQLAEEAGQRVREKNAALSDDEVTQLGRDVAVGALIYEMLKREQTHQVEFSREESLNTSGETGPRLQYLHGARLCSLLRNYPEKMAAADKTAAPMGTLAEAATAFDTALLEAPAEKELAKAVLRYPAVVQRAASDFAPNGLCAWLQEVCDLFNGYYREHMVIDAENPELTAARVALVRLLREVVGHALSLLGIPAPERL